MFQFPKKQRLCGEKKINSLFNYGNSVTEHPLRVIYKTQKSKDNVAVKTLIIVSKKRIRRAVDRNLIKRRIREAYRVNQKSLESFLHSKNSQINIALIYQKKEITNYHVIEEKINLILSRLIKEL